MSLRSFLNSVYHLYTDGLDKDGRSALDHLLESKWEHEMTPAERKREEAFRLTLSKGGVKVQRDLVGAFSQSQQPVQRTAPRMPRLEGAR